MPPSDAGPHWQVKLRGGGPPVPAPPLPRAAAGPPGVGGEVAAAAAPAEAGATVGRQSAPTESRRLRFAMLETQTVTLLPAALCDLSL